MGPPPALYCSGAGGQGREPAEGGVDTQQEAGGIVARIAMAETGREGREQVVASFGRIRRDSSPSLAQPVGDDADAGGRVANCRHYRRLRRPERGKAEIAEFAGPEDAHGEEQQPAALRLMAHARQSVQHRPRGGAQVLKALLGGEHQAEHRRVRSTREQGRRRARHQRADGGQ